MATVDRLVELARAGRLYPSVLLHGGSDAARRDAATRLARAVLCEREAAERPCGSCRHCRRIDAAVGADPFHPDFACLERDLKTSTSADRAREFLRAAGTTPYEARGQVFVVAEAGTLSPEAGDALLKQLEEPALGSPRLFVLLAGSRTDVAVTLRSRSMAVYLGAAAAPDPELVGELAGRFGAAVGRWTRRGVAIDLADAARILESAGDFADPRAEMGWRVAACAVRDAAFDPAGETASQRSRLLALADDLLVEAPSLRLRGIPADRILGGLVSRRLGASSSRPS